jgi:hypothetical protein
VPLRWQRRRRWRTVPAPPAGVLAWRVRCISGNYFFSQRGLALRAAAAPVPRRNGRRRRRFLASWLPCYRVVPWASLSPRLCHHSDRTVPVCAPAGPTGPWSRCDRPAPPTLPPRSGAGRAQASRPPPGLRVRLRRVARQAAPRLSSGRGGALPPLDARSWAGLERLAAFPRARAFQLVGGLGLRRGWCRRRMPG